MRRAIYITSVAAISFFAAGVMFDLITGSAFSSTPGITGALIDSQSLRIASEEIWNFQIVRFLCQLLLSAGVTSGAVLHILSTNAKDS